MSYIERGSKMPTVTVLLQLICIFWSLVSHFPLDNTSIDSLWGSGLVSLLASQVHQHHGHLTNFWCFWQCGRFQILLENEINIFKRLVSRRKHEVLSWLVSWFSKKHNGPTPADDIAPQIITDCGNLTLDFKQLGL